jgi:hypothetical protein
MADLKFLVTVDTATGISSLKAFEGQVDKLGQTTKGTTEQAGFFDTQLGKLTASFTASLGIVSLAHKAWSGLTGFIKDSITAATKEEETEAALRSTLAITGREVNSNAAHYLNYSQAIMAATKYSHEEVEEAQALLLQLTSLSKQGIDQATRGTIGLASALGIDLHSAAMLVAKAMEGNYGALGRYGIRVNENLSDEKKRAELLTKLEGMYQRATDYIDTYGGRLAQLKNYYGELKESIGKVIIENDAFKESVSKLIQFTKDLKTIQDAGKKTWIDSAGAVVMHTTILGVAKSLFDTTANSVHNQAEEIRSSQINLKAWGATFDSILKTLAPGVRKFFADLSEYYNKLHKDQLAPPALSVEELARLKKLEDEKKKVRDDARVWLEDNLKKWVESEKKAEDDVKKIHQDARKWLEDDYKKYVESIKKGDEEIKTAKKKALEWLEANEKAFFDGTVDKAKKAKEQTLQIINDLATSFGNLFGALSGLSKANADRQIDDSDRYYEAQKELIANSLLSEEEKAAKMKILDEKQETARKTIARSAAADEKSYSIFQAIISTAAAIINALTAKPFGPWNWVQSALAAAIGAVQIATIQAQPIPLARGFEGMVTRPTTFLAGEAGPEWLSARPGERHGGGKITHVHVGPFYFGGQKYKEQIIEIIARSSKEGTLKIAAKAIN